jgi:hypothetical protein
MEYEGSAHSESSTEKAGFEDDIVSRRSLTGSRGVVQSSRANANAAKSTSMRKLDEASECGGPWMEGCCPGIYVRDVFEMACQRLQQLLLLS